MAKSGPKIPSRPYFSSGRDRVGRLRAHQARALSGSGLALWRAKEYAAAKDHRRGDAIATSLSLSRANIRGSGVDPCVVNRLCFGFSGENIRCNSKGLRQDPTDSSPAESGCGNRAK